MKQLRIGLVGLGTVGRGVLEMARQEADALARRADLEIKVVRVCDRSWQKKRGILADVPASSEYTDILEDVNVDVVVELIGGLDPAHTIVTEAIRRGKSVVTANKALLARHGNEIFGQARAAGVHIGFEASVAGALPVIQNMRRSLVADEIRSLHCILNGTSNFIITRMEEDGMEYEQALALAQQRGFAEANPSFDVDGHDAGQKIAILAALAFDMAIMEDAVLVEGISSIRHIDHDFAYSMKRVIRPLAVAQRDAQGRISMRVYPAMVPHDHPLATVQEERNAVLIEASNSGPGLIMGLGAGARPTASAVVSDLVTIAGRDRPIVWLTGDARPEPVHAYSYRFYLRFQTQDRPGVLADIARILATESISIASVQQPPGTEPVNVFVVTHYADEDSLRRALTVIDRLPTILAPTTAVRLKGDVTPDDE